MSHAKQNSVEPAAPGSIDITLDNPTESPANNTIYLQKYLFIQNDVTRL